MHVTYQIHRLALTSTSSVLLVDLGNMFVLTGPPKVEGVTFGNNIVIDNTIHQEIKWNALQLRHSTFQQYIIRYAVSLQALLNRNGKRTESLVSNITLPLRFSTSNITYYIHVAVSTTKIMFQGDFSDPVTMAYTSEFTYIDTV